MKPSEHLSCPFCARPFASAHAFEAHRVAALDAVAHKRRCMAEEELTSAGFFATSRGFSVASQSTIGALS